MNIAFYHKYAGRFQSAAPHLAPVGAAIAAVIMLASCAANRPAPVSDARPPVPRIPAVIVPASTPADSATTAATAVEPKPFDPSKMHTVQRGDTLISVALQNGLDYRELAAWNNIENPNVIRLGDNLRLTPPDSTSMAMANSAAPNSSNIPKPGEPITAPLIITPSPGPSSALESRPLNSAQMKVEPKAGRVPYTDQAYARFSNETQVATSVILAPVATVIPSVPPISVITTPAVTATSNENIDWAWPVKGKVSGMFTDLSKGIDIPGTRGTAVLASAPGKVIYNKSGLRGYGRVVIIKHNDNWLSAYAHNEKVLVAEDEMVKKGQKIAEMGSSDTDTVKLHFEIRNKGKPLDPLKFLPAQ